MRYATRRTPRHIAIAVAASVAALVWTTAPAGALAGWTTATEVLVLGKAASFAPPPTPGSDNSGNSDTSGAGSDRSGSGGPGSGNGGSGGPGLGNGGSGGPGSGSGAGGSGGGAGTPIPVPIKNPNKAKNGTIIGVGQPPAQAAPPPTTAPAETPAPASTGGGSTAPAVESTQHPTEAATTPPAPVPSATA